MTQHRIKHKKYSDHFGYEARVECHDIFTDMLAAHKSEIQFSVDKKQFSTKHSYKVTLIHRISYHYHQSIAEYSSDFQPLPSNAGSQSITNKTESSTSGCLDLSSLESAELTYSITNR